MNVRSRKPAAGTASASVSQYETPRLRYITAVRAKYGTTEVARSSNARPRCGSAYGASDCALGTACWPAMGSASCRPGRQGSYRLESAARARPATKGSARAHQSRANWLVGLHGVYPAGIAQYL